MSDVSKREEIEKALRCLYIAVDECVARDVGKIFLAYAEDVEARLAEVERERDGVKERLSARVMVAVRSSEATHVIKCMRCENCGEELGEPAGEPDGG